ncbi:MAG: hypothetical protein ACLFM1_02285 [Bacteroidales bacterium]
MEAKEALKLWENLGKTLKRIEKHNAHKIDVDTALQQIRDIYLLVTDAQQDETNEDTHAKNERVSAVKAAPATETNSGIKKSERPAEPAEKPQTEPEVKTESQEAVSNATEDESSEMISSDMFSGTRPKTPAPKQEQKPAEPEQVDKEEDIQKEAKPSANPQSDLFGNSTFGGEKSQALGEKLGANKRAVNERIRGNNQTKDLASKLKSKPVTDIKAAIGLGDRFLFIKNLFKGNADEFNHCIEELNSKTSMAEAKECLAKYELDPENETVQYFLSIIQRKFPGND